MGYFDRVDDRVTVSLHIRYTANQETEGSQDRLTVRLLIFKMANNKVDLGQIRSEEIVYSRFIKIPLGHHPQLFLGTSTPVISCMKHGGGN